MCLFFDKTIAPENGYIADKDITCYKVLYEGTGSDDDYIWAKAIDNHSVEEAAKNSVWVSPMHYLYDWNLNEEKQSYLHVDTNSKIFRVRNHKWSGSDRTYHVANSECGTQLALTAYKYNIPINFDEPEMVLEPDWARILEGLHSITTYGNKEMEHWIRMVSYISRPCGIFRGIIPQGSRYFVSIDGATYASDRLKLVDLIEIIPGHCNKNALFTLY